MRRLLGALKRKQNGIFTASETLPHTRLPPATLPTRKAAVLLRHAIRFPLYSETTCPQRVGICPSSRDAPHPQPPALLITRPCPCIRISHPPPTPHSSQSSVGSLPMKLSAAPLTKSSSRLSSRRSGRKSMRSAAKATPALHPPPWPCSSGGLKQITTSKTPTAPSPLSNITTPSERLWRR